MLTMSVSAWEKGEPCEKHLQGWCAECREQSGMVRDGSGILRYDGDCAVQAFQEITGSDYETAVETMRAVGYRPGSGTPTEGVLKALEVAGLVAERVPWPGTFLEARSFQNAEAFFCVGSQKVGRRVVGHGWSVVNGVTNRQYDFRATATWKVTTR